MIEHLILIYNWRADLPNVRSVNSGDLFYPRLGEVPEGFRFDHLDHRFVSQDRLRHRRVTNELDVGTNTIPEDKEKVYNISRSSDELLLELRRFSFL
jgi:hypothetical protein